MNVDFWVLAIRLLIKEFILLISLKIFRYLYVSLDILIGFRIRATGDGEFYVRYCLL